jgi:AraC family transcriptional regulator
MYPDLALLREAAGNRGVRAFELEPTLSGQPSLTFARDAVVLGVAHVLRRACINRRTITDVEASGLARVLADRLVTLQYGEAPRSPAPQQLSRQTIDKLAEFIETGLTGRLTLEASPASLS